MRANPEVAGATSGKVYRTAVDIAKVISNSRGRCISRFEFQDRLGVERGTVSQAMEYLRERGVSFDYDLVDRCWWLRLQDVDWERLRIGELRDLGLVPDDEAALIELAARSSPHVAVRVGNPSGTRWRMVASRLANP